MYSGNEERGGVLGSHKMGSGGCGGVGLVKSGKRMQGEKKAEAIKTKACDSLRGRHSC